MMRLRHARARARANTHMTTVGNVFSSVSKTVDTEILMEQARMVRRIERAMSPAAVSAGNFPLYVHLLQPARDGRATAGGLAAVRHWRRRRAR
jgi:hypothetical protein